MLVPAKTACWPSGSIGLAQARIADSVGSIWCEKAEATMNPGAQTSGLSRPSRVGPRLEKNVIWPIWLTPIRERSCTVDCSFGLVQQRLLLKEPTVIARRAVPGDAISSVGS